MCVPDGRIVCWLAALAGEPVVEQITGHDLVRVGLELARERGLRVVLLGGAPGVAEGLATSLRFRHPGLQVSGLEGGRFSLTGETDRHAEVIAHVQAVAPHLLLVALGAPKAEVWLSRHLVDSGAVVGIGVGGVFDTLMGRLPRAPRWMQVAGLESLFQLFVAPRRYARRYLLEDPPTLGVAIASACWRRLVRPGRYQD